MKIKILFFMTRYYKGGTEKITLNLINTLDKDRYDITLCTLTNDGGFENEVDNHIKKIYLCDKYYRGLETILLKISPKLLYRYLIREEFDVEIAVGDGLMAKLVSNSYNKKSKKFCWIHMDVLKRGANMKEFRTAKGRINFYKNFDQIICVSKDCKDSFNKKFGFSDKTRVIYNPLQIQEILDKRDEECRTIFDKNQFNIISVGRLNKQKGYDRLIEVHRELLKEGLDHHVYIIGEGSDREHLEGKIQEYGLEKSFYLLGFKKNPYKYMYNSDLFVCSSRDEAFSTVLSESMIIGTPILTTNCSGTKELLGNNEYGIIVSNDCKGLAEGLRKILKNPEKLQIYKEKSREKIKFFELDKIILQWENLLNDSKI